MSSSGDSEGDIQHYFHLGSREIPWSSTEQIMKIILEHVNAVNIGSQSIKGAFCTVACYGCSFFTTPFTLHPPFAGFASQTSSFWPLT